MSGDYTPRAGDKIRISYTGTVTHEVDADDYFRVDHDHSRRSGAYSLHDTLLFELIEAAPVPFEVGKPLAPEMGEPPVGSVILVMAGDFAYQRRPRGWYSAYSNNTFPYQWESDFAARVQYLTLLHLGGGE